jgi:hypothetical protein
MLCCLLAAATVAPFGLWIGRKPKSAADCCAPRQRRFAAALLLIFIAAMGAVSILVLRPAPFHHICRFIVPQS